MDTVGPRGISLSCHGGQQRIVAKFVVIAQVFITQRDAVNSLGHQFLNRVLNQPR